MRCGLVDLLNMGIRPPALVFKFAAMQISGYSIANSAIAYYELVFEGVEQRFGCHF